MSQTQLFPEEKPLQVAPKKVKVKVKKNVAKKPREGNFGYPQHYLTVDDVPDFISTFLQDGFFNGERYCDRIEIADYVSLIRVPPKKKSESPRLLLRIVPPGKSGYPLYEHDIPIPSADRLNFILNAITNPVIAQIAAIMSGVQNEETASI